MGKRRKILICSPDRELDPRLLPGAIKVNAFCGHQVWVAPGSKDLLDMGYRPLCLRCLPGDIADYELRVLNDSLREASVLLGHPVSRADYIKLVKARISSMEAR